MAMIKYDFEDLVIEILTRLPVKSVIRFKCVCKMWSAVITTPNFVAMHLNRSSLDDNSHRLLVNIYGSISRQFYLYSDASLREPPVHYIDFRGNNLQEIMHSKTLQVIGCCHGLVCLFETQENVHSEVDASTINICLWNPATREFRSLPKSSLDPPHQMAFMCYIGFGFDSKSNDYKVVKTLHFVKEHDQEDVFYVEVFTLSTDSWRKLNVSVPYFYNQDYRWKGYTYVNGAFHWPAIGDQNRINADGDHRIMVSFDMGDEMFRVTQMPSFPRQYHRLLPLKDSVALITDSHLSTTPSYFDIWVLRNFRSSDNDKSWAHRRISIESVPSPLLCLPLGFWKKGEFILQVVHNASNQPVVLYDHANTQFSSLHLAPLFYDVDLHPFQESLVSVYRST